MVLHLGPSFLFRMYFIPQTCKLFGVDGQVLSRMFGLSRLFTLSAISSFRFFERCVSENISPLAPNNSYNKMQSLAQIRNVIFFSLNLRPRTYSPTDYFYAIHPPTQSYHHYTRTHFHILRALTTDRPTNHASNIHSFRTVPKTRKATPKGS